MNTYKIGRLHKITDFYRKDKNRNLFNLYKELGSMDCLGKIFSYDEPFVLLDMEICPQATENIYIKMLYKNTVGWFFFDTLHEEIILVENE